MDKSSKGKEKFDTESGGLFGSETTDELLRNGAKLVGERILPGASLLMDGKIKEGAVHAAVGIGARLAFGVPGLVVVAANSYSKSLTGKNLLEHLDELTSTAKEQDSADRS